MTTTDSAQVTPTAAASAGVQAAERAAVSVRAPAAVRAERRAWLVIWVAFATFCALVFAASKFVIDYVSTAEVPQTALVTASRGQPWFTTPGSADRTVLGARPDLKVGTVLELDRSTAASVDLQLFEDSRVSLLAGATLELTRMEVGRFRNQHTLLLTQSSGPIRYETIEGIDVQVPGAVAHLGPRGDYTIWLDGDLTRVMTYSGEAHVTSPNGATAVVPEHSRVEVYPQGTFDQVSDVRTSLVSNSDFSQHDQGWQSRDVPNDPRLDVNGYRSWVAGPDEQGQALRVLRQSVKGEHGETGLLQPLDLDVSGFRHLWLQAWVQVDYADLSGGGFFGFEYPMMFQVTYQGPREDSFNPWSVGFYYANPENRPILPNTALLWPRGEWRQFVLDLMDTDSSKRPYRLLEFAVLGQGHSYDARVADVQLIGE